MHLSQWKECMWTVAYPLRRMSQALKKQASPPLENDSNEERPKRWDRGQSWSRGSVRATFLPVTHHPFACVTMYMFGKRFRHLDSLWPL